MPAQNPISHQEIMEKAAALQPQLGNGGGRFIDILN
jgi:hypothetical protein